MTPADASKDVDKLEPSRTANGHERCYHHFGKNLGSCQVYNTMAQVPYVQMFTHEK